MYYQALTPGILLWFVPPQGLRLGFTMLKQALGTGILYVELPKLCNLNGLGLLTDKEIGNGLMIKMSAGHQRTIRSLHKIPLVQLISSIKV